jgi:hypothetical protein
MSTKKFKNTDNYDKDNYKDHTNKMWKVVQVQ